MSDDQLLAICKARAEEIERQREEGKEIFKKQLLYDSPDGVPLTRKRAKELNHHISLTLPPVDLKTVPTNEDVVQLAKADFKEDEDDDEEYVPGKNDDDDDLSDDYSTTTCSDLDSQPKTPGNALGSESDDSPNKSDPQIQYDSDEGVFKVPVEPKAPDSDLMFKRTRSKISLHETPIEKIQETFIYPDVVYEQSSEMDVEDEPWKDFLEEFQKPLSEAKDEEDENDPEYVAKKGQAAKNEDEDNRLKVTRKEVEVLIEELLEGFDDSFTPEFPNDFEIDALKESLATPANTSATTTKIAQKEISQVTIQEKEAEDSRIFLPPSITESEIFLPTSMEDCLVKSNEVTAEKQVIEPLAILDTAATFSSDVQMVFASDNRLYLIPNIDQKEPEPPPPPPPEEEEIYTDDESDEEDMSWEADPNLWVGDWNQANLMIFHRQLLAHIQLLGQNFVQTYCHPELWKHAKPFGKMLDEFHKLTQEAQHPLLKMLCWNLDDMVTICGQWKQDLDKDTDENFEYIRSMRSLKAESCQLDRFFHPRVAEVFLNHRAFMFPQYIPDRVACGKSRVMRHRTLGESILVVLCMVECNFQNILPGRVPRNYHARAANLYTKRFNYPQSKAEVAGMLNTRKLKKRGPCPIYAFVHRGEIPIIEHRLLEYKNYDAVMPLELRKKGTLTPRWDKYINGEQREMFLRYGTVPRYPKRRYLEPEESVVQDRHGRHRKPRPIHDHCKGPKLSFRGPEPPTKRGRKPKVKPDEEERPAEKEKPQSLPEVRVLVERINVPAVTESKEPKEAKRTFKVSWGEIQSLRRLIDSVKKSENRSPSLNAVREGKLLTRALHRLLSTTEKDYNARMNSLDGHSIATKIFYYIKEFDLYVRLVHAQMQMDASNLKESKPLSCGKYGNSSLLRTSGGMETLKRDPMFAWTFVDQVRTNTAKRKKSGSVTFQDFQKTLKKLKGEKPCRIEDFYHQLEFLFLRSHPQLVHSFLTYLLPSHSVQLGKFFQKTINSFGSKFLDYLDQYIEKQKEQLEIVYDALNRMSIEDGISMSKIRQWFMEIIDGNPLLQAWFLQLFPKAKDEQTDSQDAWTESYILPASYVVQMLRNLKEADASSQSSETMQVDEESSLRSVEKESPRKLLKRKKITKMEIIASCPAKPEAPKTTEWTREEDQLLFVTIQDLNEAPVAEVLRVLCEKFPSKTKEDVERRFSFIVNLIQGMCNKKEE